MDNGWICLHRSMLEWEWFDDQNTFRLFMFLLLSANHKDKKWRGIVVKKGSLVTGREKLSLKTGLSVQQIRTSICKLKSTNEITTKSTKEYTVISITNWDKYQGNDGANNQQITNEQPTSNQQATTNNNETIKQIKDKTLVDEKKLIDRDAVFEFWKLAFKKNKSTVFDEKRKKLITNALKNYSVDDLKLAITGCSKTPHNMGQNDRKTKHDGLHIILKDSENIERFIENSTNMEILNETNNGAPKTTRREHHATISGGIREQHEQAVAEALANGTL